jgi:outer membrane protein OmpA-like peptidoglycan-associated protein
MHYFRTMLMAGTALTLLAAPAAVGSAFAAERPIVLAQAEADPAVIAAEQAVEDARAAFREAMASGGDVRAARRTLNDALKSLNEARVAAGLPPLGRDGKDAPAAAESPPAEQPPAAAEQTPPPAEQPAAAETPPAEEPPAAAEAPKEQPPAAASTDEGPDLRKGKKPRKPVEAEAPPPADQPAEAAAPPSEPPAAAAEQVPGDEDAPRKPRKPGKRPQFGDGKSFEDKPPMPPMEEAKQDPSAPPAIPDAKLPKSAKDVKEGQEIQSEGGRTIVKEDGQLVIRHDDNDRFRREGGRVNVEETRDGGSITTVRRKNGVEVVTVRDGLGNITQRFRRLPNGEVEVLIGAAFGPGGPDFTDGPPRPPRIPKGPGIPPYQGGGNYDFEEYLGPMEAPIPDDYVLESRGASPYEIEEALAAPPIEEVERAYTLDEIRRSDRLRAKLRRIDVDTVTFEFGSAFVGEDQVPRLQAIAEALQSIIERDPSEVFLIEGHTDAVGSDLANLALSDRRAESVAEILTYYFEIPPENLVTQGYGEQYLKIPTPAPERENRRVTMRRIKPLMVGQNQQ